MRVMLKMTLPAAAGNRSVVEGKLPKILGQVLEELKPEAAYFLPDGKRTAILFFDLKDPSQLVAIGEPLYKELEAEIEVCPVMNAAELKSGLEKLGKK